MGTHSFIPDFNEGPRISPGPKYLPDRTFAEKQDPKTIIGTSTRDQQDKIYISKYAIPDSSHGILIPLQLTLHATGTSSYHLVFNLSFGTASLRSTRCLYCTSIFTELCTAADTSPPPATFRCTTGNTMRRTRAKARPAPAPIPSRCTARRLPPCPVESATPRGPG